MARSNINDMVAFLAVAQDQSFTRAAAKLGVTPSALSHSVKGLEERLGVRLLSRTTRNVAPTEAGERLMRSIAPHFEQIETEIASLSELRDKPAGNIRIACSDYVIDTIFRPVLKDFLPKFPDISVELAIDNGFTNIVEQRFDAGVRMGEAVAKDMIAVRIGPDWRFTVAASPSYFERRSKPETPQDLTNHVCINMRLVSAGGLYAWEFAKNGRELNVRVEGQLAFNSVLPLLNASLDGHGLAYLPDELSRPYIESGQLVEVLADWCPKIQGYHLYYPSRRQTSPAFAAFLSAIRYRT
ncbi:MULTISPECIES: LysR family transcriptional regulator [unclassified Mesorhizobium]|uniref:LysR family transcriptional regulator n=1 Tax=unclassified Mesorhizobium TaxID=325217 RepID=UPI000FDBE07F|nr:MULTISPECIES: LysR family transcriptional regulator [unclassified Mesorhizobium]TGR23169.1 LysR family transcriptional regulator [Mesorhizobium sp. M8A.F.Ca.ET.197.01.1.1]TGR39253.1 LysR family transcriptional regulator [bacterium M00.F.Ca.ET.199.01.1.1]TGR46848.1 LysR family transcriptional regulator [Mesorhizobium sp. M8A.F.Ca.ET.198.01.1.1]TGV81914.1 LysR family transcriptional regulator [Mesorhizobium sp. M00.F.Ca.ET.149.01.1.1]